MAKPCASDRPRVPPRVWIGALNPCLQASPTSWAASQCAATAYPWWQIRPSCRPRNSNPYDERFVGRVLEYGAPSMSRGRTLDGSEGPKGQCSDVIPAHSQMRRHRSRPSHTVPAWGKSDESRDPASPSHRHSGTVRHHDARLQGLSPFFQLEDGAAALSRPIDRPTSPGSKFRLQMLRAT